MRSLVAALVAASLFLALAGPAEANPKRVDFNDLAPLIDKVWDTPRWQRGAPKPKVIRYYRWALKHSASEIDRKLIKRRWRKSKRAYYRHRKYCRSGLVVEGRVSWFSDGVTASGLSASTNAGLALNINAGTDSGWNNPTTQGWVSAARNGKPVMFRVTIAGRSALMPVIDLGPHSSTGRAIDVSGPGVDRLGLSRTYFPTDSWGRAKMVPPGCM